MEKIEQLAELARTKGVQVFGNLFPTVEINRGEEWTDNEGEQTPALIIGGQYAILQLAPRKWGIYKYVVHAATYDDAGDDEWVDENLFCYPVPALGFVMNGIAAERIGNCLEEIVI